MEPRALVSLLLHAVRGRASPFTVARVVLAAARASGEVRVEVDREYPWPYSRVVVYMGAGGRGVGEALRRLRGAFRLAVLLTRGLPPRSRAWLGVGAFIELGRPRPQPM